jgi:hypothetical protein
MLAIRSSTRRELSEEEIANSVRLNMLLDLELNARPRSKSTSRASGFHAPWLEAEQERATDSENLNNGSNAASSKGRSPIRRTKRKMPPSTQKSRSAPHNQAKTLPNSKPLLRLAAPNEDNTLNQQKNAATMTTKSNNSAGDVFDKSGNPTSTPPQIKAPIRPYARLRAKRMMGSAKNYAAKIFDRNYSARY